MAGQIGSLSAIFLLCLVGGGTLCLAGEGTVAGSERSPSPSSPSERKLSKARIIGHAKCMARRDRSNNFCRSNTGLDLTGLHTVYTGPSAPTINGVATDVITNNFSNDVNDGESWKVTSGTVGNSDDTDLFGNENFVKYQKVAWLSQQLLTNPPIPGQQGTIPYAIWDVFDHGTASTVVDGWWTNIHAPPGSNGLWGGIHTSGSWNGTVSAFTDPSPQGCCGRTTFQEFEVVSTAEPPAPAILAVDLLGLGAVLFVLRRLQTP